MIQRNTGKDYRTVIAFCEALDSNPMVDTDKQTLVDPGLRNALRNAGWFVSVVDRAPVFDKDTLLHAFYQAGQFPGYSAEGIRCTLCSNVTLSNNRISASFTNQHLSPSFTNT